MITAAPPDEVVSLTVMAARWADLQRRHVPLAFGCSCGATGMHVDPRQLEMDIVEHLCARLQERKIELPSHARQATRLSELLSAASLLPEADLAVLVSYVDKALLSWERLAGKRRANKMRAEAVS